MARLVTAVPEALRRRRVLFHFAATDGEVLLQAAPSGAEGVRDRHVDVIVGGLFPRVARDGEDLIGNEELDADVEQRVALLVVMRDLDDDRAAKNVVGDAAETFDPPARGHLGGDAVRHASELNVDLHAWR